ncbi:MAG: AAA family ATPase [Thaumarchaeota archaeon]|nr:AAA family ATPase [Nitrososphaerota archaeon]MDG6908233.1 AAA family ATPase [Nitrososphaerota archaeon]
MNKERYGAIQWLDDSYYRLPTELLRWLNRDSFSFLVKGEPGTGKTTLALTLIRALGIKQNFLYVSTKSSLAEIFRDHFWLVDFLALPKEQMSIDRNRLYAQHGVFVDGRLDEQSTLFETVTDELMNQRSPLIVIDSWDSIGGMADPEASLANAKVLQNWRERASAKLILVSASNEAKMLDSVVNGIAVLRQEYSSGRRVREIMFSKLPGIEPLRPSYYFSLNGGIFKSFDPYSLSDFAIALERQPFIPSFDVSTPRRPNHVTTCYPELDRALGGGLRFRSVALVELGKTVNSRVVITLFRRMLNQVVESGDLLLLSPLAGLSADQTGTLLSLFQRKTAKESVQVFWPSSCETSGITKATERLDRLRDLCLDLRDRFPGKALVALLDLDFLVKDQGRKDQLNMQLLEFVLHQIDLAILISRKGYPSEAIALAAETKIEIVNMSGTLFLDCEVPHSQFFAISSGRHFGRNTVELEEMI